MLKNDPTLAIGGVDTAENEPPKILKKMLQFQGAQVDADAGDADAPDSDADIPPIVSLMEQAARL